MGWNPALGRNQAPRETAFAQVSGRAFWWLATAPPGEWKGATPPETHPQSRAFGREAGKVTKAGEKGRGGTPRLLLPRLLLPPLSLPLPAPSPSSPRPRGLGTSSAACRGPRASETGPTPQAAGGCSFDGPNTHPRSWCPAKTGRRQAPRAFFARVASAPAAQVPRTSAPQWRAPFEKHGVFRYEDENNRGHRTVPKRKKKLPGISGPDFRAAGGGRRAGFQPARIPPGSPRRPRRPNNDTQPADTGRLWGEQRDRSPWAPARSAGRHWARGPCAPRARAPRRPGVDATGHAGRRGRGGLPLPNLYLL
ncbi:hypothetical protein P7K49_012376 [Saguinus oedipus]|uniref:Uncharacterized protein n=1 Tax=Saguinus oedipus TaxID=9490 RepID=A0ABQ9VUV5_SAGOE|nr:hypothetical protein P7K49_012376 [Saguinus oedipus]